MPIKRGAVQLVFTPPKEIRVGVEKGPKGKPMAAAKEVAKNPEVNRVIPWRGFFGLVRGLWTAYRSGCDKVYIFFDKINIK